jgi:hypothetical protein
MTYDRSVVFSGILVSSANKTDRHDITEILLKVTLNTITLTFTLIMGGHDESYSRNRLRALNLTADTIPFLILNTLDFGHYIFKN